MASYRGNFKFTPYFVVGFAVVVAGLSLAIVIWEPEGILVILLTGAVVGLAIATTWLTVSSLVQGDPEPIRGTLAIVALIAMVTSAVAAAWQFDRDWEWLEFLVVLAVVVAAVFYFSTEWSRQWLLAMCVLAIALVLADLARVGVAEERDEQIGDRITAAVDEQGVLDSKAAVDDTTAEAELDVAAAEATEVFEGLIGPAGSDTETAGAPLVLFLGDHERPLDQSALAEANQLVAEFRSAIDELTLDLSDTRELRDAAVAVVSAYAAEATPPSNEDLVSAIATACAGAKAAAPNGCDDDAYRGGTAGDIEHDLHALDVALASYRAAVTGTDADEATRDALVAADPPSLETPIWTAVARAPGDLLDQVSDENPFRMVPGPAGWAVLAVALVFGLRVLLRRNAAQYAGPVDVVYSGDLKEELRLAVLTNLPTPGAAPGSELAQSVTDLTSITSAAGPLAGIAKAVIDALAPPQGYSVDADVAKPPEPEENDAAAKEDSGTGAITARTGGLATGANPSDDDDTSKHTRVLVRITSAADKETIATATFSHADPANAMQSAGLWAAGLLLGRSTRIPTWATWNKDTAKALGAASAVKPSLEDLEMAVRTAPSSGIVLQQYGNRLEMDGHELDAVHAYARAVAAHPRHLLARYRLGAALGMLGGDAKQWTDSPLSVRQSILLVLRRAAAETGTSAHGITALELQTSAPDVALKKAATEFLDRLRKDLSWIRRPMASLRRSDRDDVWNLQRQTNDPPRHRLWRLKRLAKFGAKVYQDPPGELSALDERAMRRPLAGWQLIYNAACLKARSTSELTSALDLLDECLTRPSVHQLEAAWVRRDIDLKNLKDEPRFQRFIERLEGTTKS